MTASHEQLRQELLTAAESATALAARLHTELLLHARLCRDARLALEERCLDEETSRELTRCVTELAKFPGLQLQALRLQNQSLRQFLDRLESGPNEDTGV